MGGDKGPAEVVEAVAAGLKKFPEVAPVILVGQEDKLEPLLKDKGLGEDARVRVHHAGEIIGMDEKPLNALRQKKNSSLVQAVNLVKEGEASAVISCGNTGALMAAGTIRLRMLPGLERPALGTVIPQRKQPFLLIDAGANPEPRAEHLVHNGVMGACYMKAALGRKKPRVALLTIGTEDGKGTELINHAHLLFSRCNGAINYVGRMEGFQMFEDYADVVVTDGFTGNVVLKSMESLWGMAKGYVKDELLRNPVRKLGAFLARGAFRDVKAQLDPAPFGGAPLLGVQGMVIKSHGSSNWEYIMHAMNIARSTLSHDMGAHLMEDVDKVNELLDTEALSDTQLKHSAPVADGA